MDENVTLAAYHEAGHALMAYIVFWNIRSINLVFEGEHFIHGVTTYDYGNDDANNPINLGRRALCLIAGPVSQSIYEQNNVINLDLLGRDGLLIDQIFETYTPLQRAEMIQDLLSLAGRVLITETNQFVIEEIANHLINHHEIHQAEFLNIVQGYEIQRLDMNA